MTFLQLETVFRVGYSVCLIPSQIILMKLPASWWLPPLELTWGILTGQSGTWHLPLHSDQT